MDREIDVSVLGEIDESTRAIVAAIGDDAPGLAKTDALADRAAALYAFASVVLGSVLAAFATLSESSEGAEDAVGARLAADAATLLETKGTPAQIPSESLPELRATAAGAIGDAARASQAAEGAQAAVVSFLLGRGLSEEAAKRVSSAVVGQVLRQLTIARGGSLPVEN